MGLERRHKPHQETYVARARQDWNMRNERPAAARMGGATGGAQSVQLVTAADLQRARTVDPTAMLEAHGFAVRMGTARRGSDEIRFDQHNDGHYVACGKGGRGDGIGDNIALVRYLTGCGFREAVEELLGSLGNTWVWPAGTAQRHPALPVRMPRFVDSARTDGREYLRCRGITTETLDEAEAQGMLGYAGPWKEWPGGVLFVGRDAGARPRSITKRLLQRYVDAEGEVWTKRDLTGSDKRYPPLLRGLADDVWLVEGGVDALALRELQRRAGHASSTVVVTGGASVLVWKDNESVRALLRAARTVVVARDWEGSPEKQANTDAGHTAQEEVVREILEPGVDVRTWWPPKGVKDLAALNEFGGAL